MYYVGTPFVRALTSDCQFISTGKIIVFFSFFFRLLPDGRPSTGLRKEVKGTRQRGDDGGGCGGGVILSTHFIVCAIFSPYS